MTRDLPGQVRLVLSFALALLMFFLCGLPTPFVAERGKAAQYLVADDSVITFRVASNIASGLGPYFNAGERTAANTSLFWPYCIAPFFRLIHDRGQTVLALAIFSALICALLAGCMVLWARSWPAALSAGLTLCALPFFPVYGNSAWEHIPQVLLVTFAFAVLTGRVRLLYGVRSQAALAILAVAFWLRPDTLPLFLPVGIAMLMDREERSRWTTYASLAFTLLMVVAYFAMHHHLYGMFVPNTYYLKVNPGVSSVFSGLAYVVRSSLNSGFVLFVFAVPLLYWARPASFSRDEVTIVAALLLQAAYICLIGGDAFRYGRFFALIGPISILLFWEKFWHAPGKSPVAMFAAAACLLGVFSACTGQYFLHTQEKVQRLQPGGGMYPLATVAEQEAGMAGYLRRHVQPADGQIGLFTLGALAYYLPEYKVADFLGKADPVIAHEPVKWGTVAHNKWDIAHTLRNRHVSVVPFTPMPKAEAEHILQTRRDFGFMAALQTDPYMTSNYTYRTWWQLGLPAGEGLLIRNDLLDRFPLQSNAPVGVQEALSR